MHNLESWMEQYGYLTLFIGLLLEYIALPFPGELMMGYSGTMIHQGQLDLITVVIVSWLGTSIGTSITYLLGRKLGYPFLVKYGPRFFLGPKKLHKTKHIFEKYGSKLLFFSFFIPGVRHFTGYLAGVLNIPFRTFALYAYSGALFWVATFIIGGKIFGARWDAIRDILSLYGVDLGAYLIAIIGICLLYGKIVKQSENRLTHSKDSRSDLRNQLILWGGLFSSTGIFIFSTSSS